jgi:hypothetical protein
MRDGRNNLPKWWGRLFTPAPFMLPPILVWLGATALTLNVVGLSVSIGAMLERVATPSGVIGYTLAVLGAFCLAVRAALALLGGQQSGGVLKNWRLAVGVEVVMLTLGLWLYHGRPMP